MNILNKILHMAYDSTELKYKVIDQLKEIVPIVKGLFEIPSDSLVPELQKLCSIAEQLSKSISLGHRLHELMKEKTS